ncbi:CCA tRNA nucleotidyltransferase [Kiloniella majae]|uniref:CCA tRNA nucleotidyltransferase n=1 Tax=Kiloniella majae TaxID=1938558 RepID=UPI000A278633|nr:CCA tRNA nucleotidyltransferase [Kiloniella majae]
MTTTYRLESQPWMLAEETQRVIEALSPQRQDVRFVGGCVRDAMLGREIKDIDIATPDHPETVIKLLEAGKIKAIPTGLDHGTITAVCNHQVFEITTLRLDVETDGRHATVAYTDNWEEDAARRDLTMNALSCRLDGTVFDPFGGVEDLREHRVRFVGDAETRIEEDALRLLRFFRFQAWYGTDVFDQEGVSAAKAKAHMLKGLSAERIHSELMKLLAAPNPLPVLRTMQENQIFSSFLPEVRSVDCLAAFISLEGRRDPLVRLIALLEGGKANEKVSIPDRLRFSTAEKQHFLSLIKPEYEIDSSTEEMLFKEALYRIGAGLVSDLLRLQMARDGVNFSDENACSLAKTIEEWRPVFFPLQGRDLIQSGVEPGPKMGRLLKATENWWIEQSFKPDQEQCLDYALKI